MAFLYITEYGSGRQAGERNATVASEPAITDQAPVAIGVSSVQSAVFNASTNLVRIHADAVCSIAFGANPTATASNQRFAAGQTEFKLVSPGHKIAVITNT